MNEEKIMRQLMETVKAVDEGFETHPKYTYSKDFYDTHPRLRMKWSVYKDLDTSKPTDDWVLDFTTDMPDGTYNVYFDYMGKIGIANGVVVDNGAFVQPATISAIEEAVRRTGYWGTFIESIGWDDEKEAFRVTIGS